MSTTRRIRLDDNSRIILSTDTLIGMITYMIINASNKNTLGYLIHDMPCDGDLFDLQDKNVLIIDCGFKRKVLNPMNRIGLKTETLSFKLTDHMILHHIWVRFMDKVKTPLILKHLLDILDGDPDTEIGYILMCYIQDNFRTIDSNIFFRGPLDKTLLLARNYVKM